MTDRWRAIIVAGVIFLVMLVAVLSDSDRGATGRADSAAPLEVVAQSQPADGPESEAQTPESDVEDGAENPKRLPQFVEVGAESCVPCKMMQPILDQMRVEYAGQLEVVMADVWKDPELGRKYQVRTIPTQVIYDAQGNEVFRHVGFWPKEEIDAKLRELGIVD